jgi:hypothetical protein
MPSAFEDSLAKLISRIDDLAAPVFSDSLAAKTLNARF